MLAGEAGDAGGVADLPASPLVAPDVVPGDAVLVLPALRSQLASDNVATKIAAAQMVVLRVLMAGSFEGLLLCRSTQAVVFNRSRRSRTWSWLRCTPWNWRSTTDFTPVGKSQTSVFR